MDVFTAANRTPFTYMLTHLDTGRRYYGARYSRGCQPSDLWTRYFTSSRIVHQLMKAEGKNAFKTEIRRVFPSVEACLEWELKVLRRLHVSTNDHWLNKSAGGKRFYSVLDREKNPNFGKHWHTPQEVRKKIAVSLSGRILPETHRLRIAAAVTGASNPMFGKVVSEETRSKIAAANRKRTQPESACRKISESQFGKKNHNYGKPMTEQQKLILLNSWRGTVWMNNGACSKRVKPDKLPDLEARGWKRGRSY